MVRIAPAAKARTKATVSGEESWKGRSRPARRARRQRDRDPHPQDPRLLPAARDETGGGGDRLGQVGDEDRRQVGGADRPALEDRQADHHRLRDPVEHGAEHDRERRSRSPGRRRRPCGHRRRGGRSASRRRRRPRSRRRCRRATAPCPDDLSAASSTRSNETALISTPAPKPMISPIARGPMRKRARPARRSRARTPRGSPTRTPRPSQRPRSGRAGASSSRDGRAGRGGGRRHVHDSQSEVHERRRGPARRRVGWPRGARHQRVTVNRAGLTGGARAGARDPGARLAERPPDPVPAGA